MYYSKAYISSEHSARYLQTLCRHFSRKVPATWDDKNGEVNFVMGNCQLAFLDEEQQLALMCSAQEEPQLTAVKGILEQHISMLSRREEIVLSWSEHKQCLES